MNKWYAMNHIPSKNYICGYCGKDITSNLGYYTVNDGVNHPNGVGYVYICHHCNKPTYISLLEQTPGSKYGEQFDEEIFDDKLTYKLYEEARSCMGVGAYTSVGMCCRKLLMHIAVDCGAKDGLRFIEYVDFLDKKGYIPVNCKSWVDIIRTKGNEANHDIVILNQDDAKQLISFIQIIIYVIYKMKYEASKYLNSSKVGD